MANATTKRVRLGEVFDLQMGKTPARANASYWGGGHKWVSIADIGNADLYISDTKETISDLAVQESGMRPIPRNTLIMSFKLSIGKVAITAEDMYSNEAIISFRDIGKCEFDLHYLFHQFRNKDWSNGSNKAVMGATLNKATLKNHEILIPTLAEQKRVAGVLDKISAMKRNAEARVQKLDLLVKSRFVEMFGDEATTLKIGDLFETQSGGTPKSSERSYYDGGDIPWLTSGEVNQGVITRTQKYITQAGLENSSAKWTPVNSVLVAMYGATAGKVGLLKVRATTNQAVCAILPREDVLPDFLYHAVSRQDNWMIQQTAGGAQPNISQGIVRRLIIPFPSMERQREFAAFVEQVEKLKATAQRECEQVDLLYRAQLQEYFE